MWGIKKQIEGARKSLGCFPAIESVSAQQDLDLHAMSFGLHGSPSYSNTFCVCLAPLYAHISYFHDRASSYDRSLSLLVLDKIPSSDQKNPGFITPEDRRLRTIAIYTRAADPFLSVRSLVGRPKKLQAMFS